MSDWQQYQEALKNTDNSRRELIRSSLISDCVESAIARHTLDVSQTKMLVQLYVDYVIGLAGAEQVKYTMQTIGVPNSIAIHEEIDVCLKKQTPRVADISEHITNEYMADEVMENDILSTISTDSDNVSESVSATPLPQIDLQSEIEETQANFNSIQPMRTMAHDMETIKQTDVPNYTGASQEELLRKKPEDLDAAEPTEQNRWGAA